jgi:hypothetical protein
MRNDAEYDLFVCETKKSADLGVGAQTTGVALSGY